MPYSFNTPEDQQAMLESIGVSSIDELFSTISDDLQLNRPLNLPAAKGELELTQHMQQLAARNESAQEKTCFLGGGSYDHFVPAVVDAIASRGEFYTSYTPYQPEVSQGNLQAMFEYQTLICELTGMDVSNASLYDGGSALAEAVIMSMNATRRSDKVVVLGSIHPEYLSILETYFNALGTQLEILPFVGGQVDLSEVEAAVDDKTACLVVQSPNFFGCIEQVQQMADIAHQHKALLVMSYDPLSLGVLKRPGDLGADIAVAEGQSLGTPMSYGGPYLGIMSCKDSFVRRMPGRIVGETVDRRGKRCWVLTLQTREQHIRREKATSNICTNQGLFALRASIYLACMGPSGMQDVGKLCAQKAHFATQEITALDRFELAFDAPFYKEFVIRDKQDQVEALLAEASEAGFFAGIHLGPWFKDMNDCFLVTVTEKRTRQEIEALVKTFALSNSPASTIHA